MEKILILYDNRGYVASSRLPGSGGKLKIELLDKKLQDKGFQVEMKGLHDLSFPSGYRGWFVLYPSSEDYGLFYKDFIEDILLRLHLDGAILLPGFEFFRAHHNKVFMELLRTNMSQEYQTLSSEVFYSVGDLKKMLGRISDYPVVLKSAEGSGSAGVKLACNEKELLRKAQKMGKIRYNGISYRKYNKLRYWLGKKKRRMMGVSIVEQPEPRGKMIVQKLVPDLSCDYKVLVFDTKYYLLRRQVREGNFRASGSGKLNFVRGGVDVDTEKILEFTAEAFRQLGTPMLSIDIAFDGVQCHMIEFQCVNFGPYALQFSSGYYGKEDGKWKEISGKSILEAEMANAVAAYARGKGKI